MLRTGRRHLADGAPVDHRGFAGHGECCRTGGVVGRFVSQMRAAGGTGATGTAGKDGDGNSTVFYDAGNDADGPDGGAAGGGGFPFIPNGNQKNSD